jgi:peptidoglycan/xylan/chitin deacetylase (PgdA/CDA1 family)
VLGSLAIATYHYLRSPTRALRPGFDAMPVAGFAGQLDYFARHYNVVHPDAVAEALRGGRALPARALLLAFDDGLIEHYTVAHPMLAARGWGGIFFACPAAIHERRLLDVHKIHLVLAHSPDRPALARAVCAMIDANATRFDLEPSKVLYGRLAKPGRYDGPDTVFVKKALQRALLPPAASALLDELVQGVVGLSQRVLADRHYLTAEQLREMVRAGHDIGGHGIAHRWLDTCSAEDKQDEVAESARFVADMRGRDGPWAFSYPFGGYDAEAARLLAEHGCAWAVSTVPRLAALDSDDPMRIPRLDTNDFPRTADAAPDQFLGQMAA